MSEYLDELEALRAENEQLKAKNEKLYKDCVSFAKKIKSSENNANRIEELEAEVTSLKDELSRLASTDRRVEYGSDYDDEFEEVSSFSEPAYAPEPEPQYVPEPQYEEEEYDDGERPIPKNHTVYKKSPLRTFVRVFLWIFLVISLLIGIISLFTYLFSTTFSEYGIANYRFATVTNSNMAPSVTKDHVILIKYSDFNGIELGAPVVTTKDTRSVAALKSVDVIDGENIATVSDRKGDYTINEDQFLGQVKLAIPYVGRVVQYACQNSYIYLAIVVTANLVSLALLLIIPSNKSRRPKFGKDYTVEDFTI